ncbi:MAG: magnesium chelatase [Phycisphaerales bacterium]
MNPPQSHHSNPDPFPTTLAELRDAGYRHRTVKQELRENTLRLLTAGTDPFPGLVGYHDTVIPQILHAILAGHDILLLGLRGQAKSRLLRATASLLDTHIPIIDHPEIDIPEDPLHPTTTRARQLVEQLGADTPIRFVHRERRYHEKLATPDVTIADLIGEIDLVKHAQGRLLSDEATMHFGLIPRSNRGLFAINELPDLPPRIQVGLFNVLEERDIQIRGYPVRMNLDLALMFSANPEDYTNRGRIVTPLKDRIGAVVRTHYPQDNAQAMRITRENAFLDRASGIPPHAPHDIQPTTAPANAAPWAMTDPPAAPRVIVPPVMHEIIEETIRKARTSPHVNQASGVSVRASIAALETLVSAAELRALRAAERSTFARITDTAHIAAALRGKIELMIAEESADAISTEDRLIHAFLGEGVKAILARHLSIERIQPIAEQFASGLRLELDAHTSANNAVATMQHVNDLLPAAAKLARSLDMNPDDEQALACCGELILEFLYVNNRLSKSIARGGSLYSR